MFLIIWTALIFHNFCETQVGISNSKVFFLEPKLYKEILIQKWNAIEKNCFFLNIHLIGKEN